MFFMLLHAVYALTGFMHCYAVVHLVFLLYFFVLSVFVFVYLVLWLPAL
jgi:hypothetical protein